MGKHGKLVNLLMKLHFIEDGQRSIKEIRKQIKRYEKRNLQLVSGWPNGMPDWARNEIYDKAGVVSVGGQYRSALILDKRENPTTQNKRMPIALLGKVYCKVEAWHSPIVVGDLLTTSDIPGHAMKAEDPTKAFGAVIGKALASLQIGPGLIPVLVALQ
jgi:hypothetical protein